MDVMYELLHRKDFCCLFVYLPLIKCIVILFCREINCIFANDIF